MAGKKPNNSEALKETSNLMEAIRLCLYGQKLYRTKAAQVLEEYYSAKDSLIGGRLSARTTLIEAIEDAIANQRTEFIIQFAQAFQIRTKKALKDHWRIADYVFRRIIRDCVVDPVTGSPPDTSYLPIPIEDLERLFQGEKATKNVSRLIDDLNLRKPEWIALRLTTDWSSGSKSL